MSGRLKRIALTAACLLSLSAPALAMGKKPAKAALGVVTATLEGPELRLELKDAQGKVSTLSGHELGCYQLSYGTNLASCLKSCDGKTVVQLTGEPNYEDVVASAEHSLYENRRSRVAHGGALIVTGKSKHGVNKLEAVKGLSSDLCVSAFDGDACLDEVSQLLSGNDPITQYRKALDSTGQAAAVELAKALREVQAQMDAKGVKGFLVQGGFVSRNLRNAPGLLCQLKSRTGQKPASLSSGSLEQALSEDRAELDRSLDFLKRYDPNQTY